MEKYLKKIIGSCFVFAIIFTSCMSAPVSAESLKAKPKNIILLIGDGMGSGA